MWGQVPGADLSPERVERITALYPLLERINEHSQAWSMSNHVYDRQDGSEVI